MKVVPFVMVTGFEYPNATVLWTVARHQLDGVDTMIESIPPAPPYQHDGFDTRSI